MMGGGHGCVLTLGLLLIGFISRPVQPCGIVTHIAIGQYISPFLKFADKVCVSHRFLRSAFLLLYICIGIKISYTCKYSTTTGRTL